jgi:hypothetical protein
MHLALKMDHREIDIDTSGSLWLRTTFREVYITRDQSGSFWPHIERTGKLAGVWRGFGWEVSFDRAEGAPMLPGRGAPRS